MIPSGAKKAAIYFRANAPWRKAMPNRMVKRHVQGVDLYLPWSHLLPDYARATPAYGQNLVELAVGLGAALDPGTPLNVLDVGANIGDSAAQIVARTTARVLCVEGDPYWIDYLRRNVGNDGRVTLAEVFLAYPGSSWSGPTPVRAHGTTHFVDDANSSAGVTTLPITELRERYPAFDTMRLVKSDTDGLDVALIPAIVEAWKERTCRVLRVRSRPDPRRRVQQSERGLGQARGTRLYACGGVGQRWHRAGPDERRRRHCQRLDPRPQSG
jgi:FkbM family methyltransferase